MSSYISRNGLLLLVFTITLFTEHCNAIVCHTLRTCDGLANLDRTKYLEPGYSERYGWHIDIDLDRWRNSDHVFLIVRVQDGDVHLDESDTTAKKFYVHGGTLIRISKPARGYKSFMFRVEAEHNNQYPELHSMNINGEEICNNPKKFGPPTETNELDLQCDDCGRRVVQHTGLVKGGSAAHEGAWPWHAALYHRSSGSLNYKCGGTLLSPNAVLTAAHCVIDASKFISATRLIVKLGIHYLSLAGKNAQEFRSQSIVPHPDFDFSKYRNDLAIIRLAMSAVFTPYVQPICLWPKEEGGLDKIIGQQGSVVGWGFADEDAEEDELRQGVMPVVSFTTCLDSNRDFFGSFLSDRNFCAGFRNGTSVCNGDSGGGMFFVKNDHYRIRGIVSLSPVQKTKAVCDPYQFMLFTDIVPYLDWIEFVLKY